MTDDNKAAFTEMEERLRRAMPLIDTPESLSRSAVAEKLRERSPERKTPIYVYFRNAVAAVLILAIGFGAVRASSVIFGGGAKKADDGYGSVSYDVSENATAGEGNKEVVSDDGSPFSYSAQSSQTNGAVITASEDVEIMKGESIHLALSAGYDGLAEDPGSGDAKVCAAEMSEADDGSTLIRIDGVSPGTAEIYLMRDGSAVYIIRVTVTE